MSGSIHSAPSPTRKHSATRFTRRDFFAGIGAVTAGLVIDATLIARHSYEVTERTLPIRQLPEAFRGFRIVQLSDIHLDEFTEPAFLRIVLHRINLLKPDLVLLTGDFASYGPFSLAVSRRAVHRCAEVLQELTCPERYAILGNHDVTIGSQLVVDALAASGIPTLVNRHLPIERYGQRFWLCGVDDPGSSSPILDLAVPRNPDGPVILMSHAPDFADQVVRHPRGPLVDVMLSGHSHGGQVRLPFLGPMVLPPMGRKYVQGSYWFDHMHLYVNRGLGAVGLPIRWNCPPEITHFTLKPV